MNIFDEVTYYDVDLSKLSLELRNNLIHEFCIESDTRKISLCKSNIDNYNIPEIAIDYNSGYFEEYELESLLLDYIGNHDHYLVLAKNCTWDGNSGYKFTEDVIDTCIRDYETSITLKETIKDGIIVNESSHDVPMGGETIILGISNKEYDKLKEASYNEIVKYVESRK